MFARVPLPTIFYVSVYVCTPYHLACPPTSGLPPAYLPATSSSPLQGSRGTELDKDFTKLETERRAKTKTAPKQADRQRDPKVRST